MKNYSLIKLSSVKTFLTKFVAVSFVLSSLILALPFNNANAQAPAAPAPAQQQGQVITADANNNELVDTMCNVLRIVTGNFGKAVAAFAIISVGIGFFTGKVSWGLMIGVAAGIAAMFGAPTIVAAITGEGAFDCR